MAETIITREYLKENPNHIFVFGDNTVRMGKGGAAILRDEPNAYGFITKRFPDNRDESFFTPDNYQETFNFELKRLNNIIVNNRSKTFLISKLGAGLANRFGIWEAIICERLEELKQHPNVRFLYEDEDK